VLLVQQSTGSCLYAGLATGGFALGSALAGPVAGRALDRFGQRVVLIALHSKALNMLLGMAALYGVAMRPRGWSNPRCICHMGLPYKVRIALRAHATS
jgi:MFS family permease